MKQTMKAILSRGLQCGSIGGAFVATDKEWSELMRDKEPGTVPYISGLKNAPRPDMPVIPESRRNTLNESRHWLTPWQYIW